MVFVGSKYDRCVDDVRRSSASTELAGGPGPVDVEGVHRDLPTGEKRREPRLSRAASPHLRDDSAGNDDRRTHFARPLNVTGGAPVTIFQRDENTRVENQRLKKW